MILSYTGYVKGNAGASIRLVAEQIAGWWEVGATESEIRLVDGTAVRVNATPSQIEFDWTTAMAGTYRAAIATNTATIAVNTTPEPAP